MGRKWFRFFKITAKWQFAAEIAGILLLKAFLFYFIWLFFIHSTQQQVSQDHLTDLFDQIAQSHKG